MTLRVLVADDQALVRSGFRMILDAREDLEVVGEAADGEEAVALAARSRMPAIPRPPPARPSPSAPSAPPHPSSRTSTSSASGRRRTTTSARRAPAWRSVFVSASWTIR